MIFVVTSTAGIHRVTFFVSVLGEELLGSSSSIFGGVASHDSYPIFRRFSTTKAATIHCLVRRWHVPDANDVLES